jgi:rubrerythrin
MSLPPRSDRNDAARIIGDPLSRRGFLTGAGLALGAGSAAFLAACGGGEGTGTGSDPERDIAILNHALTLELTAIAAYRRASEPLDGEALATFEAFLTQEQEHANALTKAIKRRGGTAAADPVRLSYPELGSRHGALAFAADVENVLIAAYLAAVQRLSASHLRAIAGEIASVEAGHLTVISGELGRPRVPDAFVSGDPGALSGAGLNGRAVG